MVLPCEDIRFLAGVNTIAYAMPISSTSNIRVEPPGIPGWEKRPYPMAAGMYISQRSPGVILVRAIVHPGIRSRSRKAGAVPERLESNVFPLIVRPV